jgi:GcrA cell cycle regulator
MTSVWIRDDVVDRLKALWVDHSATQIAGILWDEFRLEVTRNAVVGKLHRLRMTIDHKTRIDPRTRQEPGQRRPRNAVHRSAPFRKMAVESKEELILKCVEIEPRNISLLDLRPDECRYPFGDGGVEQPFTFCGHPAPKDESYCAGHAALTHRSPYHISEAEHERRRRHFMGLNKQSSKAMGVWA